MAKQYPKTPADVARLLKEDINVLDWQVDGEDSVALHNGSEYRVYDSGNGYDAICGSSYIGNFARRPDAIRACETHAAI